MEEADRIELTFRLWGTGAVEAFDEYLDRLVALLPRNQGALERRAAEVAAGPSAPDAVLVMSFPDSASVDGFFRDPLRGDLDDLATTAISRALITDSRRRRPPEGDRPAPVIDIHPPGPR